MIRSNHVLLSKIIKSSRFPSMGLRHTVRTALSSAVQDRLDALVHRHNEILEEMNSPGATTAGLGRELSSLYDAVNLNEKRVELDAERESVQELLMEASGDAELESECKDEIQRLDTETETIEAKILDAVLPKDDDDYESDTIVEIRAGTGGDEAALFAGHLMESFTKTARYNNWKVEILKESKTDLGGIREAAIAVSGSPNFRVGDEDALLLGPYGFFKFESGVHRVQRVPINDSRIHTSTCSVAVLPLAKQNDKSSEIPPSELKIETMRASGAGGQHVNTTDSAVRITHLPTGIQVSMQDERSQHQNKQKALQLIGARVRDGVQRKEREERGAMRSSLMGGGERSERIRTYNYPQDRITDHRCKVTATGIAIMLEGGENGVVVTFLTPLKAMHREELLSQLEEGA